MSKRHRTPEISSIPLSTSALSRLPVTLASELCTFLGFHELCEFAYTGRYALAIAQRPASKGDIGCRWRTMRMYPNSARAIVSTSMPRVTRLHLEPVDPFLFSTFTHSCRNVRSVTLAYRYAFSHTWIAQCGEFPYLESLSLDADSNQGSNGGPHVMCALACFAAIRRHTNGHSLSPLCAAQY